MTLAPRPIRERSEAGSDARSARISLTHIFTTIELCYAGGVPPPAAIPHPLPEPLVELIAQRFRVLSEPMRIHLLDALRERELTVQQLQEISGASQQNVSKHLGVLLREGLVSRRKEGTFSLYAIADEGVFELCEHVCGGLRRQLDELDAVLKGASSR